MNPFAWGVVAHLVADWLLQNEWMALHKTTLRHPAAWVHSGTHLLCFLPVFGWRGAALLALSHVLIDTRKPLMWWRRLIGQTNDPANSAFVPFAMLQDQAAHVLCIAVAAGLLS